MSGGTKGLARILAVLTAAVPTALALTVPGPARAVWVVPAVALGLVVVLAVSARRAAAGNWGLFALGALMAVVAGVVAQQARNRLDATSNVADADRWPTFDLTVEQVPTPPPQWAAIRGHLRPQWVLDEYAVAPGQRPDQNTPAEAVLVPLVSTRKDVITIAGPVVVARLPIEDARDDALRTLRGRIEPLPDEILATLVQLGGAGPDEDAHGVLLDTLARPHRGEAWTRLSLAVVAALIAASTLWVAAGRRS